MLQKQEVAGGSIQETRREAQTSTPPDVTGLTSETLAVSLRAQGYHCRSRDASEYPRAPFRNLGMPLNPEWVLEVFHQKFSDIGYAVPGELVNMSFKVDLSFKRVATLFLTQEEGRPVCLVVYHKVPWVAFLHQHLVKTLGSLGHPNMPLRFLPAERAMLQPSGGSDADEEVVTHSGSPFMQCAAEGAEWVYVMHLYNPLLDVIFIVLGIVLGTILGFLLGTILGFLLGTMGYWQEFGVAMVGFVVWFGLYKFGLCKYLPAVGPKLRAAVNGERVEDVKQQCPWKRPAPGETKTFMLHALSDPDPDYERLRGLWWNEIEPDPAGLAADFIQYVHREQLESTLEWLTDVDILQAVVIALGTVGNEETLRKLRRFSDRPTKSKDLQRAIRDAIATLQRKDGDEGLNGETPISFTYKEPQAGVSPTR